MTTPTPPASRSPEPLRPFGLQPRRWSRTQDRALRSGHAFRRAGRPEGCEPVLIRERTGWGWIDWTIPADGSLPRQLAGIAVFSPLVSRAQRHRLRWLARPPARRICPGPLALQPVTAAVTALALIAATPATLHGIPVSIALPAVALAPLLAEHLPEVLDARAAENARVVGARAPLPLPPPPGHLARHAHRRSRQQAATIRSGTPCRSATSPSTRPISSSAMTPAPSPPSSSRGSG